MSFTLARPVLAATCAFAACLFAAACVPSAPNPELVQRPYVDKPQSSHSAAPSLANSTIEEAFRHASESALAREGFVGFAVVDVETGQHWANKFARQPQRSASIVKVAMAAFELSRPPGEVSAGNRDKLQLLITESNDALMYELFDPRGREVINFLRSYDQRAVYSRWWGWTGVTAVGQAKFLAALSAGEVLNKNGTRELVGLMRAVVPEQRWGWSDAYPVALGSTLPVKNGWYVWDNGTATVNCLALLPFQGKPERLSAAVITSYPADLGLEYGRRTCRQVAAAFVSQIPSS